MTSDKSTLTSAQLTAAHHCAPVLNKVIVINVVALRGLQPADRAEFLALVDQAAIKGAKPILSLRSHDVAMEEMIRITLPVMVTDEIARQRLYHNGQLMFSHAELARGEGGVMGQTIADIHLGLDIYQRDVACETFIDLAREGAIQSFREALSAPKQGPAPAAAPAPAA